MTDEDTLYLREYSSCIIDTIEEFLEEKHVKIDNDEKDDETEEVIIFGSDFDSLSNSITGILLELVNTSKIRQKLIWKITVVAVNNYKIKY